MNSGLKMGFKDNRLVKFLFLFCFVVCLFRLFAVRTLFASIPEPPSVPQNYVVDLAGIIPDEREMQLNIYLKELEQKTTAQFVILTLESLDGESIDQFSLDVAHNKWQLGQKGKDNGILLTVALKERKYRFEIGYGLEGILPDGLVGSIGREFLVPYFRKGDYGKGVFTAAIAIIQTIAAQEGIEITGMPAPNKAYGKTGRKPGLFNTALGALFLLGALYLFIRHPRLLLLLLLSSSMGGSRGGWSGGGGFGGGGGGGFGGGGSSGGW